MTLQLVIAPELAPHLARALEVHVTWCRRNGVVVPDGLTAALEEARVVVRGLSAPAELPAAQDDAVPRLLLTLPEVADHLGCSTSKVKKLIVDGRLPVVMFDGVRRVRAVDLECYVEALGGAGPSFRSGVATKDAS